MAADIPTTEPQFIAAGDTAKWTRSLPDYSASDGWTLSYAFQKEGGEGQPLTFSGTASGSDHLISLGVSTTQTWTAGRYVGRGYVSKAGERYTIWEGILRVGENFAGQSIDPRTKAKKILDFIEASWAKVAAKQVIYGTIDGVQLQFRTFDDLIKARNYWATVVKSEEDRKAGRPRTSILARFSNPI